MAEFVPGIVTTPTKATRSVHWRESNLMRWSSGRLNPIGGWALTTYAETASPIRRMFSWRSKDGRRYTALLCEKNLYVDINGTLVDITPANGMTAPFGGVGGFGDGLHSKGTYGTPRPLGTREILNTVYSLSNWGEDLIAMTSADGRLLRWSPSTPNAKAVVVPSAPLNSRSFVVTPERFVILFDFAGNMGEFAWCNQEDIEAWNFADPLSKAGNLPIYPPSPHHSSLLVPGGVLAFTQSAAHIVEYVGGAFVHSSRNVDETGNAPMSDRSIVPYPSGAIWLSRGGAWRFDGVSVSPIECPVWNWIKDYCNFDFARFTACAVHVPSNSEVFFFFPSEAKFKNDRYVLYNYKEGWWANGRMSRSAGIAPSYNAYPLMADDTKVYQHEYGHVYTGSPEMPWIESYPFTSSSRDTTVMQMEPDVEGDFGCVRFSLNYRNSLARGKSSHSPLRQVIDDRVDFLVTGRELRLLVQEVGPRNGLWTLGDSDISMKTVTKK